MAKGSVDGWAMADWVLHWLEAEGDLSAWRAPVEAELRSAKDAIETLLPAPRLDVLIERSGRVIPERGIGGHAYRPSLFSLRLDPGNPHFKPSLQSGKLKRTAAHEVHHCLRMAGPGYGKTLGEALVSEGLAGHFAQALLGGAPEPWECALDAAALRVHMPDAAVLGARNYDHAAWFFGAGGEHPRWLGYALGHMLVKGWLDGMSVMTGSAWIDTPASPILEKGLAALA